MMDQFLRHAKSQSKLYGLYSNHKADPSTQSSWNTDACKLNSCYSRVARQSGLTSTQPTSRHISQETLRRSENSAREATEFQQMPVQCAAEYAGPAQDCTF